MNELMRTLKRPINFYSTRITHNSRRRKNELKRLILMVRHLAAGSKGLQLARKNGAILPLTVNRVSFV